MGAYVEAEAAREDDALRNELVAVERALHRLVDVELEGPDGAEVEELEEFAAWGQARESEPAEGKEGEDGHILVERL